jgi:hypothetical protein
MNRLLCVLTVVALAPVGCEDYPSGLSDAATAPGGQDAASQGGTAPGNMPRSECLSGVLCIGADEKHVCTNQQSCNNALPKPQC